MPNPTILIAEDDETYRNLFADKFREEKFRALAAADGEEAWELLRGETPDALVTGILMPRLDGLSLIERVRKDDRYAQMKIFVLSHHGRPEDRQRADTLHVDGFFMMGYVPFAEIVLRVKAALRVAPTFTIRLDPEAFDMESRQALAVLGKTILCTRCDGAYTARFEPDALRPLGFFSVFVECPKCNVPP